ncbi:putative N-acetyltransferase YnaD [Pseudocercospora fuligena]|uniref:Putative N-acetyltransferase YnaD n=1 Tax=Pseudocercospora fuligena TaxID=685502 RepID=A0A8H6VIS9_9PEZI|nr:putative N-acetyltransferase YnaD [Pseudocercospora fuligena]
MEEVDPFSSKRLIYRAVEPAEDEAFFLTIQQDPIAWRNSNAAIARPQSKKDAISYMKHCAEEALIGVVICLAPADEKSKAVPIGAMHLSPVRSHLGHHRYTEIGIDIIKPYQGQGYGTEAIEWILEWAFETAGMHRVAIQCFEYNEGARRLYERIGFKHEGTSREMLYHRGRWWDDLQFGMLDREWQRVRDRKAVQTEKDLFLQGMTEHAQC